MNLRDQVRRSLLHAPATEEELAKRLNQQLPNMRRILALMSGSELGANHKPLPKEVEVIDGKYHAVKRRDHGGKS